MRCYLLRLSALGVVLFLLPGVRAEETAAAQELKELRQSVQQQTKQIELLAEQVARLTRAMGGQKAPELAVPAAPLEKPAPDPAPEAPKVETVPKAELVTKPEPPVAGAKHVVAKGETLTSIAKQYNIPITELKNANKIENERKLQIGQILIVPTAKTPETPDKKENP